MNRNIATSVVRNTTVMLAQQLATWASTFVLMLFLPRYLGPAEFGRLFLALSLAMIFGMVVSFGGFQPVAKQVSRSPETAPQTMVDAIGFRLILSLVSMIAMIAFSFIVGYDSQMRIFIAICSLGLLWQGVHTVLYGCYQGFEQLPYTSIGAITERVFVSVVGVGALLLGARTITIAIILTISTLLNTLVLVKFAPRIINSLPRINWKSSFAFFKDAVPYFIFTVFGVIYYRVDTVMLSLFTADNVVGWYGAAYRFFDVLNFLPSIYNIAVFPVLSKMWKKEGDMHARTAQKSMEFLILAGIPISIGVFLFAPEIVRILYGLSGFQPSIVVLQVLCTGLIFLYVDMVLGTTLLASDRQKQLSIVAICATPLNIGLNYFLIPLTQSSMGNGGIGSALATAITEFSVMIAAMSIMPRGIFKGFRYIIIPKAILAGAVMALGVVGLRMAGAHWVAGLAVSPVLYAGTLLAVRTIDPAERDFVRSLATLDNLKKTFMPNRSAPPAEEPGSGS
jgi:O-antigen/teichoic acid export membrane protein